MTDPAFAGIRQLLSSTTLGDYLSSRPPAGIVVLRTDWTLERSLKASPLAFFFTGPRVRDTPSFA